MIKILLAVVAALTVLLGVHMMFELVAAATLIGVFAVAAKVLETGMHYRPRLVARLA